MLLQEEEHRSQLQLKSKELGGKEQTGQRDEKKTCAAAMKEEKTSAYYRKENERKISAQKNHLLAIDFYCKNNVVHRSTLHMYWR